VTAPARARAHGGWWLWASAPLAVQLGISTGQGWAGIAAAGAVAWLFLVRERAVPRAALVEALLVWAAVLSLSFILAVQMDEARAAAAIPHGPAYWAEMRTWVETGAGRESSPAQFIPEHLLHLAAFAALSAATAGLGGLVLGAWLIGFMSYYVAEVMLHARSPLLAGLLAWHPWSVLRVAAFVILGVSLARLLLDRVPASRWWADERRSVAIAMTLWVADLALKAALAPVWPRFIRAAM
jgi:hypothetical protein